MSKKEDFYTEGDVDSTERGSGARANKGKVSFALFPLHLLTGACRVFMGGLLKYAAWNWTKGMKWSIPYDCTQRHLFKFFYMGEDIDPESGEHHLDMVLCNVLMLKHYTLTYKEGDDRPPTDLTRFAEWMKDLQTNFDEEAYLKRNPEIAAIVAERHRRQAEENV